MREVFNVRCSPRPRRPPQYLQSRTLSPARCACTPRSLAASRLPARSPHRTVCPACDPRQSAYAFNQPLSWDTSGVTDMSWMFHVRCAPCAPAPQSAVSPSPVHAARTPRPRATSRLPARSPPRTVCPACDPRQLAEAFDQPLSWDTSSVTNMYQLFSVRCSPLPRPPICSRTLSPARCVHTASRRLPPPGPQPAPHRVPCLRPSAVRVRLQPAAELEHLPRQAHRQHVSRAARRPPPPTIWSCALSSARCVHRGRPPPPPRPAPCALLATLRRPRGPSTSR